MSANQKNTESDKDRDSDDYDNEFDSFAPPPQTQNNQQNNTQQQGINPVSINGFTSSISFSYPMTFFVSLI